MIQRFSHGLTWECLNSPSDWKLLSGTYACEVFLGFDGEGTWWISTDQDDDAVGFPSFNSAAATIAKAYERDLKCL